MSFISQFGGDSNINATGLNSIKRAMDSGMTISQIESQLAQQGVSMGPAAQDYVNQNRNSFIGKYGGSGTSGASGLGSVQRAQADGMSLEEIQAQQTSWGPAAQNYFSEQARKKQLALDKAKQGTGTNYGGQYGLQAPKATESYEYKIEKPEVKQTATPADEFAQNYQKMLMDSLKKGEFTNPVQEMNNNSNSSADRDNSNFDQTNNSGGQAEFDPSKNEYKAETYKTQQYDPGKQYKSGYYMDGQKDSYGYKWGGY